jgi:hypothetical protein
MIQAFSHIFNFFNIASPCGDMCGKNLRTLLYVYIYLWMIFLEKKC